MDVSDAQQQQRQQSDTSQNLHPLQNSNICITISPSNPLTTSKSENNIFDKNMSINASQFNVVSLSDLSDDAQYTSVENNGGLHYMNDLSRTQVLNRLSDEYVNVDGNLTNRF
jgi:CMP-N-acetylneuraminic acid synthetase